MAKLPQPIKGKPSWRRIVNAGYQPVTYKTDRGTMNCYILSEGPKWMRLGMIGPIGTPGYVKRVRVTEKKYMYACDKRGQATGVAL